MRHIFLALALLIASHAQAQQAVYQSCIEISKDYSICEFSYYSGSEAEDRAWSRCRKEYTWFTCWNTTRITKVTYESKNSSYNNYSNSSYSSQYSQTSSSSQGQVTLKLSAKVKITDGGVDKKSEAISPEELDSVESSKALAFLKSSRSLGAYVGSYSLKPTGVGEESLMSIQLNNCAVSPYQNESFKSAGLIYSDAKDANGCLTDLPEIQIKTANEEYGEDLLKTLKNGLPLICTVHSGELTRMKVDNVIEDHIRFKKVTCYP